MHITLVAIKDRATETFNVPLAFKTQNEAIRWFTYQLTAAPTTDSNVMMKGNPDDYDLYHIADYDDETALTSNRTPIAKIADGKTIANTKG